ncbi:nucleotidyltransferase domain-containing protein [Natrarchaeobius chitinivorans]|uniref:Nucleotidyltransferase n=1 Tax=Natrarchaeobius chitinivorans TaxID=1679083 RepID=A0A3N6M8A0_NATCH|nr:nucleotidyltransferase domain-containing protein [Natrarchaeobius chitinivorans]RQG92430.1 nucleotidyltransferase [Natrarchaeobius chitinivorans]
MTTVPAAVVDAVDGSVAALESDRDVRVVLAAARGSHGWAAAGPESDYDVGLVFVQSDLRRYAHVTEPPTTIVASERLEDGDCAGIDLEFQGWDVRTFASLLVDSNDGAIDLLRSPIRYRSAYDPADLAAYVERTYDPMDLYHAWRGIATSNYRKYVSHHLVRTDDETFPIVETTDDGYVVETDDGTATVSAENDRYTETQTRATVKRNLTICRASMYARYLRATGERCDHDLPALEFDRFLTEQAPTAFEDDRIDRARALLERKRRGEGGVTVGDVVGRSFAHPPREIDPAVHARDGPDADRIDRFVDEMIAATRAGDSDAVL